MNDLFLMIMTFLACFGYAIHINVRGKYIYLAAFGGSITYLVYALAGPFGSIVTRCFIASIASSIYSEVLARICKVPATTFLIISILPLVPGSNVYKTMVLCINGEIMDFIASMLETLGIAGAIALGILFVSSFFRFFTLIRKKIFVKKSRCI